LKSDFANNLRVGDFISAVNGDLVVMDGEESDGAFDALAIVGTNIGALAEAAKLVLIGGVPDGRKKGVSA
jgi:hypothetical protein